MKIKNIVLLISGLAFILSSIFIVCNLIILSSYAYPSDIEALESLNSYTYKAYDYTIFKYETDDGEFIIFSDGDGGTSSAMLKKKRINGLERYMLFQEETSVFSMKSDNEPWVISKHLEFVTSNSEIDTNDFFSDNYKPLKQEIAIYGSSGSIYKIYIYILDETGKGELFVNEKNKVMDN